MKTKERERERSGERSTTKMRSPSLIIFLVLILTIHLSRCNGEDEKRCKCPKMLQFACGADGKDYNHPCLAECAGTVRKLQ